MRVTATTASAMQATSWPQAMNIAASAFATLACRPTAPVCAEPACAWAQQRTMASVSARQ